MGELYERILDQHPTEPRLKIGHWFESLMGEYGAGDITGAEATTAFEALSGGPLSVTMQTEVQDLIGTVTALPVVAAPTPPVQPGGTTATVLRQYTTDVRNFAQTYAQRAEGLALRAHKIRRITQILELAQHHAPGYTTPEVLRTRLGVPTR
jgi:hypothetical protein